MSPRKATLISNPKTGRYASRRRPVQELAAQLESLGIKIDLKLTQRPGDAAEIAARAARNGTSDVIVAGGDGTINEAIQDWRAQTRGSPSFRAAPETFSHASSVCHSMTNKR